MPKCEFCDYGYDMQPGELNACGCKERSKIFDEKDIKKDPTRCNYRGREDKCEFFMLEEK